MRRVGLCVGQNQMCHLCGWLKLNLKKCAVGKIKNTEGSAMSVGSVAVQLQYGLYVVAYLSKLAFHFMFKVVCLVVVVSSVRLACNSFIPATQKFLHGSFLFYDSNLRKKNNQTNPQLSVWNRFQTLPSVSNRITNVSKRLFSWGNGFCFVILLYGVGRYGPKKNECLEAKFQKASPVFYKVA